MFSWLTSYWYPNGNVDYIDPDSPEQTIKYVFLEKIKYIEENVGRNINKIYKLESKNNTLRQNLHRANNTISTLHYQIQNLEKRLETIEKKLDGSIVLEQLPPLHIN